MGCVEGEGESRRRRLFNHRTSSRSEEKGRTRTRTRTVVLSRTKGSPSNVRARDVVLIATTSSPRCPYMLLQAFRDGACSTRGWERTARAGLFTEAPTTSPSVTSRTPYQPCRVFEEIELVLL